MTGNTASPRLARGGKSVYGAPLGILMPQARFPRIPGDRGNATTWPLPARCRVVRGTSPSRVVLKCTNMHPYAAALREALGLPVFDIYTLVSWFHGGLRPRAV